MLRKCCDKELNEYYCESMLPFHTSSNGDGRYLDLVLLLELEVMLLILIIKMTSTDSASWSLASTPNVSYFTLNRMQGLF